MTKTSHSSDLGFANYKMLAVTLIISKSHSHSKVHESENVLLTCNVNISKY